MGKNQLNKSYQNKINFNSLKLPGMGAEVEMHLQIRVTSHRTEHALDSRPSHMTAGHVVPEILDIVKDFNASRTTKHLRLVEAMRDGKMELQRHFILESLGTNCALENYLHVLFQIVFTNLIDFRRF